MPKRIINVFLQGTTLLTRFGLIFLLAKFLSPAEVGYYGLFTAAVGYSLYFVGLDFYTYLTREIIKTPIDERAGLLKGQVLLSLILYVFFIPISILLIIKYSGWPEYLIWYFFPILLVEHFNQELSRLLVALYEPVFASLILFVRQGSWALLVIFIMLFDQDSRNLEFPMIGWFFSGIGAALLGIYKLRKIGVGDWRRKINWQWIKKGVVVSSAFLFSTLALRGMQTFDRYILESLGGVEVVGAYVLFVGVAGSLLAFLDSGVFSFTYPELIRLNQKEKFTEFRKKIKQMLWITIFLSMIFFIISLIAMPYILRWIGKDFYISSINLYYWILFATIVNAIGLVPHYALYAAGKDSVIIISHVLAFFVFLIVVFFLHSMNSVLAVPQGLFAAFLFIILYKTIFYIKMIKPHASEMTD